MGDVTNEKIKKILGRIQTLRAIAGSTHSRAEAETTLSLAAKLIAEYQLEEAEITAHQDTSGNRDSDNDPIDLEGESIIYEAGKRNLWKAELACGIAELNGLFLYNAQVRGGKNHRLVTRFRVIGRKSDVEISLYMMSYLVEEIGRLVLDYIPRCEKRGVSPERESWCLGCVRGFLAKMRAEKDAVMKRATSTALVFIGNKSEEARKLFLGKTGIRLRASTYENKSRHVSDTFQSGWRAGQKLSVSPGINGSANEKLAK